jgi:hypothetical protein
MTRLGKAIMIAGVLVAAVAGSAYADDAHPYTTPNFGPKVSGGNNTQSTHFQKPPGYDQNPWMRPYEKGQKPS